MWILNKKQVTFAANIAELISWAGSNGIAVTLGEAWRSTCTSQCYVEQGIGTTPSQHERRLAVDLSVIEGGKYMKGLEAYRALGEYWETLDSRNYWGGHFARGDGTHFEMR